MHRHGCRTSLLSSAMRRTAPWSHWHCSRDRHVVYGLQRLTDSQPSRPYTFTLPLLTFDPLSLASQVVELWNRSRCFEPRGFVFAAISRRPVAVGSLACALLCARHLRMELRSHAALVPLVEEDLPPIFIFSLSRSKEPSPVHSLRKSKKPGVTLFALEQAELGI